MTIGQLIAWTLWAANAAAAALSLSLAGPETGVMAAIVLGCSTVGTLVASRHPSNPIGWVFCATGSIAALQALGLGYALQMLSLGVVSPHGLAAAWIQEWAWIPLIGLPTVIVLLLFPDGRLPSPGWRFVLWGGIAGMVVAVLGFALQSGNLSNDPRLSGIANPLGLWPGGGAIGAAGLLLLLVSAGLAAASLVVRYRRADGDERQQIKWFAYSGALMGFLVVAGSTLWRISPLARQVVPFSLLLGPAGAGIGILRYRLYDIDRVINMTLVYTVLSGLLGAVYIILVYLLSQLASVLGSDSSLSVAVSVLAVAALFHPARRRLQAAIDMRFYRSRYDAARTVEAFGRTLRATGDPETLPDELVALTSRTMRPAHVSLWLSNSR